MQQPDYTPSEYKPLVQALQDNNLEKAKQVYQQLLAEQVKKHTDDPDPQHAAQMDLQKYFEGYAKSHGNADKNQEAAFVKTLTYHQQQLYKQVQDQQQAISDLFFNTIQPKTSGHEPRGFRPPRLPKGAHFSTRL